MQCLVLLVAVLGVCSASVDDHLPYNAVLFAGTHNSAINLGAHTVGRPSGALGGNYPSEANSAYQYIVMDQRLSVRDQLDQGIRVIDLEVAAITGTTWDCNSSQVTDQHCSEVVHMSGRCFTDCPFLISHGSVQQSVGELMGYTYPETVFSSIAEWIKQPKNAAEIVTILMMATHGNPQPTTAAVLDRMNATGLLPHIWNPTEGFSRFPTLGEMRGAGKTVMIATGYGWGWGPSFVGSSTDSTGIKGAGDTMEGWDSITFDQLAPDRARLSGEPNFNGSVMVIEVLPPLPCIALAATHSAATHSTALAATHFAALVATHSAALVATHSAALVATHSALAATHSAATHSAALVATHSALAATHSAATHSAALVATLLHWWLLILHWQLLTLLHWWLLILHWQLLTLLLLTLLHWQNLSSRRGRSASSVKYWPLPNELDDFPFQAGGNPAQAVLAANYTHVRALETQWAALLKPYRVQSNWLLVDFFNTSTPVRGTPSRTLLPNEDDGLVRAVRDINIERRKKLLDS